MTEEDMIAYKGITEERFKQLWEDPELRPEAVEEIWAELCRMRSILFAQREAHHRMLGWEIDESQGDKTLEEWLEMLRHMEDSGIGLAK